MKKIFFCTSFFITISFLHSMDQNPIAKILIKRDMHNRPATAYHSTNPSMEDVFFLEDEDQESRTIFTTIKNHEEQHGYRPTEIIDGRYTIPATNYLEKDVQYFWDEPKTSVTVRINVQ
jgi:hypothetical protein